MYLQYKAQNILLCATDRHAFELAWCYWLVMVPHCISQTSEQTAHRDTSSKTRTTLHSIVIGISLPRLLLHAPNTSFAKVSNMIG
jgi:hypothetical protein